MRERRVASETSPFLAPPPLCVQELSQVGLVGSKAVPCGPELPHVVPAVLAFPLRLQNAHRDYGINPPTPVAPRWISNRHDLDLVALSRRDEELSRHRYRDIEARTARTRSRRRMRSNDVDCQKQD